MSELILASSSVFRRELLERLQHPFRCISPDIDESRKDGETPIALAERLSLEKATAVAADYPNATIIGSDQVPALGNMLLSKPGTVDNAAAQLRASAGNTVNFITGLAVLWRTPEGLPKSHISHVTTVVNFRDFGEAEIKNYLTHEDALSCAGSFKSEGLGISLMESMQTDDPTALIGLPLIRLCSALRDAGLSLP